MRRGLFLLILLVVLCSCDDGSERETPVSTNQTAARAFVTITISDPKTFNPVLVVDQGSGEAAELVFEGLVRTSAVTLETEPVLAERWEHDESGTQWTFHLRKHVLWHDRTPFTAADVEFTFRAIFDERVPNSAKYVLMVDGKPIEVKAIDDHTVQVKTARPFAPLLSAVALPILPAHLLAKSLEDGTFVRQWGVDVAPEKIVGTGPYRMVRYMPAQFIQYERNPLYWKKDENGTALPYLQNRTILIVPDQNTAYLKFMAGEASVLRPRPEEVSTLLQKAESMHLTVKEVGIDTGTLFVAFNRNPRHYVRDGKRDPRLDWFENPKFRQAIAHAIDKQAMIISCLSGQGQAGVAHVSPANTVYHNATLQDYVYDLERARQLLAEGGFADRNGDSFLEDSDGNTVQFTLTTSAGNQVREKMCSILKDDWTKLGLKVDYRPLDFTALVEKLSTTFDWDAVLIGFTGGPEPHNGSNFLRSDGNLHFWNPRQEKPATAWEAEIDALLDQGSRVLEPAERRPHYWRIQEILHRELPFIQTVRQIWHIAHVGAVENYRRTVWGTDQEELIRFRDVP
jgi:peptide/nickel transport system substrate-binding protein